MVHVLHVDKNMKKILLVTIIVIAAAVVALLLPDYSAGTSYPNYDVTSAVRSGAETLGGVLEDERTVSGSLRHAGPLGQVGLWIRKLTGQAPPSDVHEFSVRFGSEMIVITSMSRVGDVH